MPLDRTDIEAGLKKKGFVEEDRDHRFYALVVEGHYTGIMTKTSKGTGHKTLGDNLVGLMARQLKLTKKQFVDLVTCPLSLDDYVALLKQTGEF
jgi:hypothetical protein